MPGYNILKVAGSSLGYKHTEESLAKLSEALSGENHPLFGRSPSVETRTLFSEAKKGKPHTAQTLDKMSIAKGTAIYVYDTQGSLENTFNSARKAAEHFGCSYPTILKFAKNGLLFKEEWILSTS
jgi:group I intron endonuclease